MAGTAFTATERAGQLGPHLAGAIAARSWQERQERLSAAYEIVAGLHNERRLTVPLDPKVRPFHDRPFQVLDAYRFTDALMGTITDLQLRALPLVGAIDQYVDSSDMTDPRRRRSVGGTSMARHKTSNAEQRGRLRTRSPAAAPDTTQPPTTARWRIRSEPAARQRVASGMTANRLPQRRPAPTHAS